jgi:cytochrome c556
MSNMKFVSLAVFGLMLCAPVLSSSVSFAATPEEIISTRQANQKRVGDLTGAMKKALEGGATAASQLEATKELDDRAHRLGGYFPAGTETGGNTKARPEIWTNRAGFDEADNAYTSAIDKLLVLAQAGDTAGFTAQFATVGGTCGACHRNFRVR